MNGQDTLQCDGGDLEHGGNMTGFRKQLERLARTEMHGKGGLLKAIAEERYVASGKAESK